MKNLLKSMLVFLCVLLSVFFVMVTAYYLSEGYAFFLGTGLVVAWAMAYITLSNLKSKEKEVVTHHSTQNSPERLDSGAFCELESVGEVVFHEMACSYLGYCPFLSKTVVYDFYEDSGEGVVSILTGEIGKVPQKIRFSVKIKEKVKESHD